jgi:NAD(P) transhydrogenase subunit alpha
LYSTNLLRLAEELCKTKDGVIDVNFEDDAIRGLTVIKEGSITWPPPAPRLSAQPAKPKAAAPVVKPAVHKPKCKWGSKFPVLCQ